MSIDNSTQYMFVELIVMKCYTKNFNLESEIIPSEYKQ